MSPVKAIAIGIVFNVVAILAMERIRQLWKGSPPVFALEPWLWYAVIAVSIVTVQFCLIVASLAESFPMYVAITILIAFVLAIAMFNGCRATGRWPTLGESAWLAIFLATAFVFQYVSTSAEKAHLDRTQKAAPRQES